jgi:hypothetical protein
MLWQNFAKNLFYTGRYDLPEMLFQRPVKFPTVVTRILLTGWIRLMDHQKAESFLLKQYSGLLEFWPIRGWKLKIRSTAVLSRNRIQQRRQWSKFCIF